MLLSRSLLSPYRDQLTIKRVAQLCRRLCELAEHCRPSHPTRHRPSPVRTISEAPSAARRVKIPGLGLAMHILDGASASAQLGSLLCIRTSDQHPLMCSTMRIFSPLSRGVVG